MKTACILFMRMTDDRKLTAIQRTLAHATRHPKYVKNW